MARAISITQLYSKKRKLLMFDGEFAASFGTPELKGAWFVWGNSGNGKTSFVLQLCKYLTKFGRVAYNSMEEGDSESFKIACQRERMEEAKRKFILLDKEPIAELKERLRKRKAPQVVVIDSIQYSQMSYSEYTELLNEFGNTLFLIISHSEGKEPEGKIAKKIRFDAFIKIRVEGFVAFVKSRYGGDKPYTIWDEGAEKYHGLDFKSK